MKKNQQAVKMTVPPLVEVKNNQVVTTSLQVAQYFGREHKNVLMSIRNLDCSSSFQGLNFKRSFYISDLGNLGQKKNPLVYMTKDGFTFLVMGFTGKIAAKFKEDYINAFNEMEKLISHEVDEQYIVKELKTYFDEMSAVMQNQFISLRKEAGVSIGLCDMPTSVTINENKTLMENLRWVLPLMRRGITEGWWAMFHKVKVEKEMQQMRKTMRTIATIMYQNYKILPEQL